MSDRIVRAFEDKRNNPFTFKHIKLCHSMAEIDALPEPKVSKALLPTSWGQRSDEIQGSLWTCQEFWP